MRQDIRNGTILVTGGAGFIGSHLVDRLFLEGAKEVIIVDNMFLGNEDNLKNAISQGAVLYKDDAEIISSLEYIIEKHKINVVFNLATKALNYSFSNPSNAFLTNVNIINNLLELQRKGRFKTLCHYSTSEVYGTAVYEPMDEKHPFNPTTTYAAGKAAADIMIQAYVKMFNLDSFILRPFNNYGPRQNYSGDLAGIIPKTVCKILIGEKPEIHGTGKQSRDFIYVLDTVDATVRLYNIMKKGDCVNISTNGQKSIDELMDEIVVRMEYSDEILNKNARKADVECHNASNKKLKSMIEFSFTPFRDGLRKTIEWYIKEFGK